MPAGRLVVLVTNTFLDCLLKIIGLTALRIRSFSPLNDDVCLLHASTVVPSSPFFCALISHTDSNGRRPLYRPLTAF